MKADDALADLNGQLRNAVSFFWSTRSAQGERQGEETGDRDRGGRAAVTGAGHCGEFVRIIRNLLVGSGIPDAHLFTNRRVTDLPGYFRASKDWDLVAVVDGTLLAVVELKSQVGSFGNNFNNRTEEEFRGTSYADRYTILCKRLVLERLYDAACLIVSSRETGPSGDFKEPSPQLSFRLFATSLVGHATAYAKLRGSVLLPRLHPARLVRRSAVR